MYFWRVEVGDFYSVCQEAILGPDTKSVMSEIIRELLASDQLASKEEGRREAVSSTVLEL
jgi:hypothetical protein